MRTKCNAARGLKSIPFLPIPSKAYREKGKLMHLSTLEARLHTATTIDKTNQEGHRNEKFEQFSSRERSKRRPCASSIMSNEVPPTTTSTKATEPLAAGAIFSNLEDLFAAFAQEDARLKQLDPTYEPSQCVILEDDKAIAREPRINEVITLQKMLPSYHPIASGLTEQVRPLVPKPQDLQLGT